jgi:hypothetical protein
MGRSSLFGLAAALAAAWGPTAAHPATSDYATSPGGSDKLPLASPPGEENSFHKDLDLPEVRHYSGEVLRAVQGGFFPVTVAQLAVVRVGGPVQALLIQADGHAPWRVRSRATGSVSWQRFEVLRKQLLDALVADAMQFDPHLLVICSDDGTGAVEYANAPQGLTVRLDRCQDEHTIAVEYQIIATVREAVAVR